MGEKKLTTKKRGIEPYEHRDKTRANNPDVGLVTPSTDPDEPAKTYAHDPHLDPQLSWAGKAGNTSFEVPTVSLHVTPKTGQLVKVAIFEIISVQRITDGKETHLSCPAVQGQSRP